ncbi:hypothetical protein [Amycolatopsis circi]|uniref:hypothetical protein n=1 Tax=Amycolatopsis circi TaxID=871959 RepID=UPI0013BE8E48|nr:hypothetical protein [Amycolatopsis circi]
MSDSRNETVTTTPFQPTTVASGTKCASAADAAPVPAARSAAVSLAESPELARYAKTSPSTRSVLHGGILRFR